ncbi:Serine/threonine protein kinase PrkC, regulator of stationary phase [Fimbriiglobus ruber]|uniref:Serine/threonine protein kinase PrkC, regulator of stationary phase n=2 Tax=Fimbriiglobus ruber TaxID=1908690 RepID=A0A225E2Q6_9BACT|nr:Serine/threonine protein kinase PrkC, regulator of stationary phase [Fimbriiglobus ruber]
MPAVWPLIDGYEILAEIGRGGMGVVYKARQAHPERLVALKVIRDGPLASPQVEARFRIEAEAAARMRHPNIVSIYEVGQSAGRAFFTMELVEGGTLAQHLGGRPQPATKAATLARFLALAVAHAHEQNIVHRDLKPSNILLSHAGVDSSRIGRETGEYSAGTANHSEATFSLKITDFGLAKRLDTDSTGWTLDGAILGTPGYMAPEQAAGRVQEIGPRTDIYALGAVLYEMLTGRPPFEADTREQMVRQILHDEPTPPTRILADLPRDLETVCLKCLEKEPARRYPTAGDLAHDLDRFLDGRAVVALPPSARERLARQAERDGYQIISEIGRGPRSIVYHARYTPLKQMVAVKVFPEGTVTQDEWDTRLGRSSDLWSALTHPQIVPVHRAGWWAGSAYQILEYFPGGSLTDRLRSHRFTVPEALLLTSQLAEIVGYLHRQGVVHGNLKPSNILLAASDIPRITDFWLTGGLFHGSHKVENGPLAGLGYLAPEMVSDPANDPRPHTDVYGLGIILYELLMGRPPFIESSPEAIMEQVRSQDAPLLSHVNPDVTPALEAVCMRCLRKDPWRRFTRAYDLLIRLRRLLEDPTDRTTRDRNRRGRPPGTGDTT